MYTFILKKHYFVEYVRVGGLVFRNVKIPFNKKNPDFDTSLDLWVKQYTGSSNEEITYSNATLKGWL